MKKLWLGLWILAGLLFSLGLPLAVFGATGIMDSPAIQLTFEGDSRTAVTNGISANNWPSVLVTNYLADRQTKMNNYAASGDTAAAIVNEYATNGHQNAPGSRRGYYFLWAGVNDIGSSATSNTVINALSNVLKSARADGYKTAVLTIPPNYTWAATDAKTTNINAVNAWLLSATNLSDYQIDLASAMTVSDTADSLHFTDGANDKIASIVFQVVFSGQQKIGYGGETMMAKSAKIVGNVAPFKTLVLGRTTQNDTYRNSTIYNWNDNLTLVGGSNGFQLNNITYTKALMQANDTAVTFGVPIVGDGSSLTNFTNFPSLTVKGAGGGYNSLTIGDTPSNGSAAIYAYNGLLTLRLGYGGWQINDSSNTLSILNGYANAVKLWVDGYHQKTFVSPTNAAPSAAALANNMTCFWNSNGWLFLSYTNKAGTVTNQLLNSTK